MEQILIKIIIKKNKNNTIFNKKKNESKEK